MKLLFAAIYNRILADTSLKNYFAGHLYLNKAPQNAKGEINVPYPYVTYRLITQRHSGTFSSFIEDYLIQFDIFCDDYDKFVDGIDKLQGDGQGITGFDKAILSLSGYVLAKMIRQTSLHFFVKNVYQQSITYSLSVETK